MAKGSVFGRRLRKLQAAIGRAGTDGVLMAPGPNVRYYTGVQSQILERPFLFFVPIDGEPHLVAPNLESGPYARSPLAIRLHRWDDASGPAGAFADLRKEVHLRGVWGCEGRVPYGYLREVAARGLRLQAADPVLEAMREVKDDEELEAVREATKLLARAYLRIPELMKPGLTESQLATALREEIFGLGAEAVDFCSVQAGAHAADPHWAPSSSKMKTGDCVLIDTCCTLSGYNADITRTFVIGKNRDVEKAYGQVLEAQTDALGSVSPGVRVGEVDAAARDSLSAAGMGQYFFHRTGHGLGLDVHERPYIVKGGRERLRKGMVFTVEPGVYFEGKFGVRIEDDVIVSAGGREVATSLVPKEFGWWA